MYVYKYYVIYIDEMIPNASTPMVDGCPHGDLPCLKTKHFMYLKWRNPHISAETCQTFVVT